MKRKNDLDVDAVVGGDNDREAAATNWSRVGPFFTPLLSVVYPPSFCDDIYIDTSP